MSLVLILGATDARGDLLGGFTLTNVINAGAARPGIAIGGVFFDPALNRLFLAGNSDGNTPTANLFEFTAGGVKITETEVNTGGITISSISGYPGSKDFTITHGNTLVRIARNGSVITSKTLSGVESLAGVALNPLTGHLWVAESIGNTDTLRKLDANFNVLQTVSYASLFPGENILGLEIEPLTGNFLAALPNRIVEFDPGVTTVLSTLVISNPQWSSLTSLSIGGPRASRKLYVSSGTTDRIFEFSSVPEPSSFLLLAISVSLVVVRECQHRKQRDKC